MKTAIRKYVSTRPGTFWWDWLPEVLMGLRMTVCRSHGHTPFFLLHKQDPFVAARPLEVDARYPIVWDSPPEAEGDLAE